MASGLNGLGYVNGVCACDFVLVFLYQDQVKMDAAILDGLIKRMLPDIYKQFTVT